MEMQDIINYLDEHLYDDMSLVELGKLVGYSSWHMYKLFKFYTGEPLTSYIHKRRLLLAAQDMEKCGMAFKGKIRGGSMFAGEICDCLQYAALKSDIVK